MKECCVRTIGAIKSFLKLREVGLRRKERVIERKKRKSKDDTCTLLVYYCYRRETLNLRKFLAETDNPKPK